MKASFACFIVALFAASCFGTSEYYSDWDVIFTNVTAVPASYDFGREDIFLPKNSTAPSSREPLPCDILKQRDVPITLRDDTIIYADVFLPANQSGPFPALLNLSPYGKSTPSSPPSGVGPATFSGWAKFEGADAAAYTCRGYAVVNPDNRGAYRSEGRIHFWGSVDAHDGYDVIEWIADQSWSSGKVATFGASWLAITQWLVAALNPPHLTAIVPWDGFSDFYRDNVMWGGIPDLTVSKGVIKTMVGSSIERPDLMTEVHPYMDAYWEDKSALLENVTVPAYVVADNIMPLHTKGAVEGYRRIQSTDKWLRIDDTQEWNDMYNPLWQQDAVQFLDHYLKGIENGWQKTPRVRAAITNAGGSNRQAYFEQWPIETTEYQRFYLHGDSNDLSTTPASSESIAAYNGSTGNVTFVTTFLNDTQLIGYFSGHLFVEAAGANDMDLFLTIEKLDKDGNLLAPLPACTADLENGCISAAGSSHGSEARLRVSLRALDLQKSKPFFPVQSFKAPQKLRPGEVVRVDVAFVPNAYLFEAGQKLRLVISGHSSCNPSAGQKGTHIVHTGGKYQSYIQIPVIPE